MFLYFLDFYMDHKDPDILTWPNIYGNVQSIFKMSISYEDILKDIVLNQLIEENRSLICSCRNPASPRNYARLPHIDGSFTVPANHIQYPMKFLEHFCV